MHDQAMTSTKPYLIRAIHEWCSDNGLTPYLAVSVDATVHVPMEYVSDGEIVLNSSYDATSALQLGNEFISFKARFGGKPRDISVPVDRVLAVYARENGQGMAFPPPEYQSLSESAKLRVEQPSYVGNADNGWSASSPQADKPVIQLVPSTPTAEEKSLTDDLPKSSLAQPAERPALRLIK